MFEVGPALFGPEIGVGIADLAGQLYMLPGEEGEGEGQGQEGGGPWGEARMGDGCQGFSEEAAKESKEKVVVMARGGCLFIQKVRDKGSRDAFSKPLIRIKTLIKCIKDTLSIKDVHSVWTKLMLKMLFVCCPQVRNAEKAGASAAIIAGEYRSTMYSMLELIETT